MCSCDVTLHQCELAWVVSAFFLRDIVGEVYDFHNKLREVIFFYISEKGLVNCEA